MCSDFMFTMHFAHLHESSVVVVVVVVIFSIVVYCAGGSPSSSTRHSMCIRVHYRRPDSSEHAGDGYFHTFCSTGTRLFNNIVITLRSEDDARGNSIYCQLSSAVQPP